MEWKEIKVKESKQKKARKKESKQAQNKIKLCTKLYDKSVTSRLIQFEKSNGTQFYGIIRN